MPRRALRSIRDGILGLAYPEECRVCGNSVDSWDDGVVCDECWNDPALTKILTGRVCAKCGAPMAPPTNDPQSSENQTAGRLCGTCSDAPFAAARACGVYSGAFEASILFLKTAPHICPRLRAIILRAFSENSRELRSDLVIPIPLHRLRERQRGFNQAAVVARLISGEFDLRFDNRSLRRIKLTERHRAGMDASDRARSVDRAFEARAPRLIRGASVLLVDDVYTTGSTICAAARSLIDAGASHVNVLTIARVGDH